MTVPLKGDTQRDDDRAFGRKSRAAADEVAGPQTWQARLAQLAVSHFVGQGILIAPPAHVPAEALSRRAGVFVCLKTHGALRGCIGTTVPTQPSLAQEIIRNAVQAATSDPRFRPVDRTELPGLSYTVDVLSEPAPVHHTSDLDPKRYGVIVRAGPATGLLLPDLDGVDSVEQQVDIARRKAGIDPRQKVQLLRFTVERFG